MGWVVGVYRQRGVVVGGWGLERAELLPPSPPPPLLPHVPLLRFIRPLEGNFAVETNPAIQGDNAPPPPPPSVKHMGWNRCLPRRVVVVVLLVVVASAEVSVAVWGDPSPG